MSTFKVWWPESTVTCGQWTTADTAMEIESHGAQWAAEAFCAAINCDAGFPPPFPHDECTNLTVMVAELREDGYPKQVEAFDITVEPTVSFDFYSMPARRWPQI